jgi:hypothetical protein
MRVLRFAGHGRWDYVIEEAPMLIIGDQQKRLLPSRTLSEDAIDIGDESFASVHRKIRVLAASKASRIIIVPQAR